MVPNPGIEPGSPALQADFLLSEPPGKPYTLISTQLKTQEKAMAPHSGNLAWKTPWMEEPGTSIESVMPSSHLILCRPLLLLPPIPPSIRGFSRESIVLIVKGTEHLLVRCFLMDRSLLLSKANCPAKHGLSLQEAEDSQAMRSFWMGLE